MPRILTVEIIWFGGVDGNQIQFISITASNGAGRQ